jgi:hypothetical protein
MRTNQLILNAGRELYIKHGGKGRPGFRVLKKVHIGVSSGNTGDKRTLIPYP